ncbi:MAG: hypothetical protein AB3N16_00205, partial [Flavobacteriaceae bacterium]
MRKRIVFIISMFMSTWVFSQTTVTLEDQCNCEVLSGTDVSAAGSVTPTGADTGDIYVNTGTGTIYFWDGDSWELTSGTDVDTQIADFTLVDTNSDTTDDTLRLTDDNGGQWDVALSDLANLIDTDDQNAAEVAYDNSGSGLTATSVQDAIDEINAAADNVSLIDNGDGTYLFTDASGGTVTISDTSISTLADNGDGTYTYTNESGDA